MQYRVDIADTAVSFTIAEGDKKLAAWWYAALPGDLLGNLVTALSLRSGRPGCLSNGVSELAQTA